MNEHEVARLALVQGIQAALAGPSAPVAPQVPGVPSDASQSVRDAAIREIASKPSHLRTQDEAAYVAAVKDAAVLATLSKPIDQVTSEERAELLRQIRECEGRGWQ